MYVNCAVLLGLKKPVFMDQMKSERRAHQLVASVQLKWLHKCVADLESREAKGIYSSYTLE